MRAEKGLPTNVVIDGIGRNAVHLLALSNRNGNSKRRLSAFGSQSRFDVREAHEAVY
jgi:hypothetical protein